MNKYYVNAENIKTELKNLPLPEAFKTALIGAAPATGWLLIEPGVSGISVKDVNPKDVPTEILIKE